MSRVLAALLLVVSTAVAALDDPMRPPAAYSSPRSSQAGPAQPEFVLNSTYIARNRRVAVINGKTVAVGDRVGDAEVTDILPTRVRLQKQGSELVVRLLPVNVKAPAKTEEQEHQ